MDEAKEGSIEKYWEILKNGLVDILHEGKEEAQKMARGKRRKGGKIQQIEEGSKEERKRGRENKGDDEDQK